MHMYVNGWIYIGENIYPKEIENILYTHPLIDECVVIGHIDEKWGQIPIFYVVSSLNEHEILEYIFNKLAKYKIPKKIIYLKELPKNSVGKILKRDFWRNYMKPMYDMEASMMQRPMNMQMPMICKCLWI